MAHRHQFGAEGFDFVLQLLRPKDRSPLGMDGAHFGATAPRNFYFQMTKASEHRDQHFVTGFNERHQGGLDRAARRAVDHQGPAVLGLEDTSVELRGLGHVVPKLRVKLTQHLHRHGAQHAGVGIHGAWAHHQAWCWVQVIEFGCHGLHD